MWLKQIGGSKFYCLNDPITFKSQLHGPYSLWACMSTKFFFYCTQGFRWSDYLRRATNMFLVLKMYFNFILWCTVVQNSQEWRNSGPKRFRPPDNGFLRWVGCLGRHSSVPLASSTVVHRTDLKICFLIKALNGVAPKYIYDTLTTCCWIRLLRFPSMFC